MVIFTLPRILVVDDEVGITRVCKIALEDNGFEVDVFNDPKQALTNFKRAHYDLLLIDIKMAGMSGFDLYRELRKIDEKAMAIFMTAFEPYENEALKEFLSIKGNLLKKPFEMSELVSSVRKELSREPMGKRRIKR